jgi:putative N6-adenine-specific DNA methylase
VKAAGLSDCITIEQQDFKDFEQPKEKSILVTNPPYGERISTPDLLGTYRMIGERLKHQFQGGDAWVLSYREECFEQIGLKPSIKIPLYNGSLECEFRKYQMFDGKLRQFRSEGGVVKTEEEKRQMAEKHRFKKERDFKQRITEQEENEDGDIRSFTFHRHGVDERSERRDFRGERKEFRGERKDFRNERKEFRGERKDFRNERKEFRDERKGREGGEYKGERRGSFDRRGGKPDYKSSGNRGGHERFDRSGGKAKGRRQDFGDKKSRNRFDDHED